ERQDTPDQRTEHGWLLPGHLFKVGDTTHAGQRLENHVLQRRGHSVRRAFRAAARLSTLGHLDVSILDDVRPCRRGSQSRGNVHRRIVPEPSCGLLMASDSSFSSSVPGDVETPGRMNIPGATSVLWLTGMKLQRLALLGTC